MTSSEQPRDRWERPLIMPEGGGKLVPYTRISTLSKALSDTTGLANWKIRMAVKGGILRHDLMALAQAAVHNNDDKALDRIAKQMLDAAGSSSKANVGTALHSYAEAHDRGELPLVPPEYQAVLDHYRRATEPLQMLGSEKFVVVDELQCAGSFDRIVQLPDGRIVVADIKTGAREPQYPLPATIQIAAYAHGTVYDHTLKVPRKGTLADFGVDQETGLMIHLPADGSGCFLYLLDLKAGWLAAQRATWVRTANRDRSIIEPVKWGASS